MTLRKTTSLTCLIAFILLLITSIILYLTPQGKIAFWANWKMLGLDKQQWGALHTNLGILFVVAGIIHIVLNWKPIVVYLKNKARKLTIVTGDFNLALVITLLIALFTLLEWQPLKAIQDLNHTLKKQAARKYGEPPYGHAEANKLKAFCRKTGLSLNDALIQLETADLQGISLEASLADIAKANQLSPQQVYDIIKPQQSESQTNALPQRPPSGFGRTTLAELCATYELDLQETMSGLKNAGISADPDATMKELAESHDTEPYEIYQAIREIHGR